MYCSWSTRDAVPVLRRDPLALEERERMRPGRADAQPPGAGDLADVAAQLPQLDLHVGGRVADRRRDLEHRLHQLGVDVLLQLVALHGGEHGVDVLDEVVRLAVEEHVLLLDAQRVRVALAEGVVEHAAASGEARSLAGDRRREDLLRGHETIASASISTSHRGSSSPATTMNAVTREHVGEDLAVRAADLFPVARRRAGRRGCGRRPPLWRRPRASAATTISRQRFACRYGSSGVSTPSG